MVRLTRSSKMAKPVSASPITPGFRRVSEIWAVLRGAQP